MVRASRRSTFLECVAATVACLLAAGGTVSAQPAAAPRDVLLVTIRVLSATEPADQFEIVSVSAARGVLPRTAPVAADAPIDAPPTPELRLIDADGRVIHRQAFTWSRVLTVPLLPPGVADDGSPRIVAVERPEVTVVLPAVAGADRVEVRAQGASAPAAVLSVRDLAPPPSPPAPTPAPPPAPTPASAGTLNILLIGSDFASSPTAFDQVASTVESAFRSTAPFASMGSALRFYRSAPTGSLGCNPACNGIARLMCCSNQAVVAAATASGAPFDEIVVLHNTGTYAGGGARDLGSYKSNSYNSYATAYNGTWTGPMVIHEFGHSFGNLCDEYAYTTEGYTYNPCVNCRPTCSQLGSTAAACQTGCDAVSTYARPESSIMLQLDVATFNGPSIYNDGADDALQTRVNYFAGATTTVPSAPLNLQSSVSGSNVTLSWAAVTTDTPQVAWSAATSYLLQVGTSAGASNLYNANVGSTTTVSGSVGAGAYFWRVSGVNAAGTGPASQEAQFTVGSTCTAAPGAPAGLSAAVAGSQVTLAWAAPSQGPVTGYILEAGSASGLANLYNASVGTGLSLATTAAAGTYFVRVRAVNDCGTGPASSEVTVVVGL